jgi:hypothetical protein
MIRTMKALTIIGLFFLAQGALLANGLDQVIYDNGGPTGSSSFLSDLDGWTSGTNTVANERASDFSIASGYRITDFHWWGLYQNPAGGTDLVAEDDFHIRIFSSENGLPSDLLYDFNVGSNVNRNQLSTRYEYSAFITPLDLTPDILFWLSIVNDTGNDPDGWYWTTASDANPGDLFRPTSADSWTIGMGEMAYQITGQPVPEPTSLILLCTGLSVIGVAAWRRKK